MKLCSKCQNEKSLDSFAWKNKTNGSRQAYCKECHRAYSREHYGKNKSAYTRKAQVNNLNYRKRNRQFLADYLRDNPCVDCGETDIEVLQFDHEEMLHGAGSRIGGFTSGSIVKLEEQLALCEIRCANCHYRRTRRQMGWVWPESSNLSGATKH